MKKRKWKKVKKSKEGERVHERRNRKITERRKGRSK